ncbi:MAG: hypothetical protein IK096_00960 [Lachnospiraceae bacterium]|nr:hypothetical protein [Lachnospiraceae bacterium]
MYEDIIDLPYDGSATHPHMPMEKRAAQFSPFAALKGYDDAVEDTARRLNQPEEILIEIHDDP